MLPEPSTRNTKFAVVADEISKLADQTSSSIKDIDTLIQTIHTDIHEGISSVTNTTAIFRGIIEDINETGAIIGRIYDFIKLQLVYNDSVNRDAQKMRDLSGEIRDGCARY